MKTAFMLVAILISMTAQAKPGGQPNTCKQKVKNAILNAAKGAGFTHKIDFNLEDPTPTGADATFSVGRFTSLEPDGGYILNSGAEVLVRAPQGKCEILKLTVNLGAL